MLSHSASVHVCSIQVLSELHVIVGMYSSGYGLKCQWYKNSNGNFKFRKDRVVTYVDVFIVR